MRDEFLSEEDLDLRNLSEEELYAWWNEWLRLAQATNDLDEHLYSHGVFREAPRTVAPVMLPPAENSHTTTIQVGDRVVRTLADIIPRQPGLKALFIAKRPALVSVEAGHYFQGKQGTMFWNRLREYGLLSGTSAFDDDLLLDHGYGITDIVKDPGEYGREPSDEEYIAGMDRIMSLIQIHHPSVVVFVYKRVLDRILELRMDIRSKSIYGFNLDFERHFGSRVFAFPLPGTPCTSLQASAAMNELAAALRQI